MDLDDSFAEKIIQRSKARRELISERKGADASSVCKKRPVLDEQQINSEEPPRESPKRQCIQAQPSVYLAYDKENIEIENDVLNDAYVPFRATSKVKGLAALKKTSNADEDSKVMKTSEPQVNTCQTYVFSTNTRDMCSGTKSRLTNLAADIRQWEDNTHKPALSSKNVASNNVPPNLPHLTNTPNSSSKSNIISMKLYYTNKTPNVTESEKHVVPVPNQTNFPISGNGNFQTIPTRNESNIVDDSGVSKKGRLQAWDQAIAATLDTPTSSRCPLKPIVETSKNEIKANQKTKAYHNVDESEYSDDESINEDDFAENYDEINHEHKNNYEMELNYSPIKSTQDNRNARPQTNSEMVKISTPVVEESINANVDPAELPLAARKALFEKALLGGSSKQKIDVVEQNLSVAQRAALFENASKSHSHAKPTSTFKEPKRIAFSNFSKFNSNQTVKSPVKPVQSVPKPVPSPVKESPVKKTVSVPLPSTPSPTKNIGNHTRIIQQKLIENSSNWQEREIITKASEERKQELSNLVNRWEKISSSSAESSNSEGKCKLASDEQYSVESDMGEEYSDYEESPSGSMNENADQRYESSNIESDPENVFEKQNHETESIKSLEGDCDDEQDLHSEDAQSNSTQDDRVMILSRSNSGISSLSDDTSYSATKSQSYTSGSSVRSFEMTASDANDGTPSSSTESKNPDIPLAYTVSFYRKQKQETRLTPVRTIVRREKISSPESPKEDNVQIIQNRIKGLQEEILRQQTVISQTSQALNLCIATAEFSGSTEQVEGERLLLIATQKRQACLNEIQRLKSYGAQGENVNDGTGTLIITDLQLPLKREFMASELQGKGSDTVHYFLCLIRHGAQVIVTQMMSTLDNVTNGALNFTNHIKLQNLTADFSVVFEVYALQTKKEVLTHEKKYHIKREHSKIRLTPKGKKLDGKMPAISSPGGPNAVRSPSFGVVGYTRFTLQNFNKHIFTLDKVPFTSPLDGMLRVKLQLLAEHNVVERGFLTMFEDVSGFGAWHRRWCLLDAHHLAYWKYPDDEQKKEPLGILDLRQCVTREVRLVSRDVCARAHTFQLVTVRPQAKGDKNTLISRSVNTLTTIKHLLSADTKEERILWCNKLNRALTNIRKWDPQAFRPVESMQELQF